MCSRGLDPDLIALVLRRHGITHAQLAAELNVGRSTVSTGIFTGSPESLRMRISQIIGIPPEKLWPWKYSNNKNYNEMCELITETIVLEFPPITEGGADELDNQRAK